MHGEYNYNYTLKSVCDINSVGYNLDHCMGSSAIFGDENYAGIMGTFNNYM